MTYRAPLFLVAGLIVVLDQLTKHWALAALAPGEVVKVFGSDLVWLVLVFNTGTAFGLRLLPPVLLLIVALAASIGLAAYLGTSRLAWRQGLPFALIMGGAVGNVIDRIRFGRVVDFVSVDMPDALMERWPVFNVADSAVSVGVVLLLIINLFGHGQARRPGDKRAEFGGAL